MSNFRFDHGFIFPALSLRHVKLLLPLNFPQQKGFSMKRLFYIVAAMFRKVTVSSSTCILLGLDYNAAGMCHAKISGRMWCISPDNTMHLRRFVIIFNVGNSAGFLDSHLPLLHYNAR